MLLYEFSLFVSPFSLLCSWSLTTTLVVFQWNVGSEIEDFTFRLFFHVPVRRSDGTWPLKSGRQLSGETARIHTGSPELNSLGNKLGDEILTLLLGRTSARSRRPQHQKLQGCPQKLPPTLERLGVHSLFLPFFYLRIVSAWTLFLTCLATESWWVQLPISWLPGQANNDICCRCIKMLIKFPTH